MAALCRGLTPGGNQNAACEHKKSVKIDLSGTTWTSVAKSIAFSKREGPRFPSRPLPEFFALVESSPLFQNHDSPMPNITRRKFLEDSILAAAAAASIPTPLLAAESRAVSANDKITVAIIGCGIRGKQHA